MSRERGSNVGNDMDGTSSARHIREESPWTVLGVPLLGLGLALCGAVLIRSSGGPVAARSDAGALVGLAAAALGCTVVLVWCLTAVLALLAVLARLHGRHGLATACGRCSPAVLRRVAATVLGVQLLAVPAAAADEEISPFWTGLDAVSTVGAPGADVSGRSPDPVTDREQDPPEAPPGAAPSSGEPPAAAGTEGAPGAAVRPGGAPSPEARPPCPSPAERTVDGAVTVVRGDTLWSLAASHLGPGATDEQIARAWPAWYELNRHVLVDGPHLLLPGQRLLVPTPAGG